MFRQDVRKVILRERYIPGPGSEAAVRINRSHPLVEELPLRAVVLSILALDLENQRYAIGQTDEEVRSIFLHHPVEDEGDFEAEGAVFSPHGHRRIGARSRGS